MSLSIKSMLVLGTSVAIAAFLHCNMCQIWRSGRENFFCFIPCMCTVMNSLTSQKCLVEPVEGWSAAICEVWLSRYSQSCHSVFLFDVHDNFSHLHVKGLSIRLFSFTIRRPTRGARKNLVASSSYFAITVPELGLDLDLDPLKNVSAPTIAAIVITTMAIHFLRPCRVNLQVLK